MKEHKDKEMVAFGRAVRSFRREAKLSQDELAHQSGLHRTYVGSVERGERNISLKNILLLAKTLKVSGAELIALTEKMEQHEE